MIETLTTYVMGLLVWQWLTAIGVIIFTLFAGFYHKKYTPIIWGILISCLIIFFPLYFETALFGWITNTDIIIITLSFIYMIMFYMILIQGIFNSLRYGRVVS